MHELTEFVLPLRHSVRKIHVILPLSESAVVKIYNEYYDAVYTCIPLYDYTNHKVCVHIASENSSLLKLFTKITDIEKYDITIETHFVGFTCFNESGLITELYDKQIVLNNSWKKPSYGEIYALVKKKNDEVMKTIQILKEKRNEYKK